MMTSSTRRQRDGGRSSSTAAGSIVWPLVLLVAVPDLTRSVACLEGSHEHGKVIVTVTPES
jgi:hypothetical protein